MKNSADGATEQKSPLSIKQLAPSGPAMLSRSLSAVDAAALVVSNVIGIGIFTTPGIVAQMVPHPLAMLSIWFVGGVLAFIGASAYAELASLRPRAGGEYVYLYEAFGPLVAFLTGWTSFVAGFSGAIAAGAVGVAAYLGSFVPAIVDARPLFTVPLYVTRVDVTRSKAIAVLVIVAISLVHVRGLGPGRVLQNSLTGLKVAALLLLIVVGFTVGSGSISHLNEAEAVRPARWLMALIPVMFTYSGWNAAAYVAEEVRDPTRNLPKALAMGTVTVIILYLLLNLLYIYALPLSRLAGVISVGNAAAEALFGISAAGALTALMLMALIGSLSAMILAGPRVYYAMARDGLFLRAAARVHARFRSPATAILMQAAWSSILVVSGTFEQLLTYTGFAVVLFAGIAVFALFVLRRKCAQQARAYKALGYPAAPALFVLTSLAIAANAVGESPAPSVAGLLVIAAGMPIYWWSRRSR
jgi:APA family basic amino acid/polyamine antiporter